MWAAVLTVGLLVLAQQDAYVTTLLSPGPVTLHHGEVGACGNCHDAFDHGPVGWIFAAFASTDPLADSKKCLACHETGENAFRPHGLAKGALAKLTHEIVARGPVAPKPVGLTSARTLFSMPTQATGALNCANCHKEHRGQGFDQANMINDRCQFCHSVQFISFSSGHPGFEAYPFTRRTRINFDHVTHIRRHFEKAGPEKAPGTCTDCHTPAPDGRLMLIDNFAKTCAACHLEQIEGVDQVGPKGIPFLVVPGLDLAELRERRAAIGEWPEWSEERVTPFMKVLLDEAASFAADMERLESLDLLDLSGSSDRDIEAIERLAWRVKELIHRLIVSGVGKMKDPLSEALGQKVDHVALRRLFGMVPADVIRSIQAAWFPNLAEELSQIRRGERVPMSGGAEAEAVPAESTDIGVPGAPVTPASDDILSEDEGDILSEDDDDILSEGEGEILSEDEGEILSEDEGEILSEDEGEILSEDEGEILSEDEGEILSDEDTLSEEGGSDATETAEESAEGIAMIPEPDPEAWAALGGWYRRDFVLYYKPLGHADRFVRAWLDFSGRTFGTPHQPVGAALFSAMADERSPGRCTKCHSVDREAGGVMNTKWRPRQPQPGIKAATIFSHATHFGMLHEKGCLTCHALEPTANYADGYKGNDPLTFAANFSPIDRATCATCHVEEGAGDSCLLCHRYHVGAFTTRPGFTEMQ